LKRIISITVSIIAFLLLFALFVYCNFPQLLAIKWAITSIIEVPICTARAADKLGIEHDLPAVKDYILQSLKPGMTPDEVERTLGEIAPVGITQSFLNEKQGTNTEILIRLCDNPLGNMVLLVYYSKDGHLINVIDAYDE
jgi:hypothetical protein